LAKVETLVDQIRETREMITMKDDEIDKILELTKTEALAGVESEDELNDHGKKMWDLITSELPKVISIAKSTHQLSAQYVNAVTSSATQEQDSFLPSDLSRSVGGGRKSKSSCRSASTGKKSKKNKGCDAVLPINLNYGCWCHADSTDIFKGKGQHVDEFDKACKMYKQCLRCVRHDARNDGEVCDPGTQKYFTENSRSKDGIHAECSANNDSNCAINTCCCEVEYVRTILKLFMIDGVKLNKKKYHSSNHFDFEDQCEVNKAPGNEVDCCGEYPTRRMYNTQHRQCCHNTSVFDPYTNVCCDDGETARSVEECDDINRKRKRKRREAMTSARRNKAYTKQRR